MTERYLDVLFEMSEDENRVINEAEEFDFKNWGVPVFEAVKNIVQILREKKEDQLVFFESGKTEREVKSVVDYIKDLAEKSANSLKAQGVKAVNIGADFSYFYSNPDKKRFEDLSHPAVKQLVEGFGFSYV